MARYLIDTDVMVDISRTVVAARNIRGSWRDCDRGRPHARFEKPKALSHD